MRSLGHAGNLENDSDQYENHEEIRKGFFRSVEIADYPSYVPFVERYVKEEDGKQVRQFDYPQSNVRFGDGLVF